MNFSRIIGLFARFSFSFLLGSVCAGIIMQSMEDRAFLYQPMAGTNEVGPQMVRSMAPDLTVEEQQRYDQTCTFLSSGLAQLQSDLQEVTDPGEWNARFDFVNSEVLRYSCDIDMAPALRDALRRFK